MHPPRLVVRSSDRVALDLAVVGERVERLLRHRVDRVADREVRDVHRVAVLRVLDAGRGPQWALRAGARRPSAPRTARRRTLLVRLVRQPRVRDGGVAAQVRRLADCRRPRGACRSRCRRGRRRTTRPSGSSTGRGRWPWPARDPEVGVHHLVVAVEPEDQRDVDADAVGEHAVIAARPSSVAGILMNRFGRSTSAHRSLADAIVASLSCARWGRPRSRRGRRRRRWPRRARARRRRCGRRGGDREDRLVDVLAGGGEARDLVVVPLARRQRGREDRRVRRHPDDVAVLDEFGEVAGLEALARQVVEPDGHPCVGKGLESRRHLPGRLLVADVGDRGLGGGDRVLRGGRDCLGGDPELRVDTLVVGRRAVVLERHDPTGVADDVAPALSYGCLNADPGPDIAWEHAVAVRVVLLVEPLAARHRHDAGPMPSLASSSRALTELHLGAGADEDDVGRTAVGVDQDVAAQGDAVAAA